jgi:aminomethyltransferase
MACVPWFQFAPENPRVRPAETLLTTPLHALHLELGARMVPFAGYSMPVQYPAGLMAEHHHTRNAAGLFDVSHMGQLRLVGADAAAAFETLMPVDVIGLAVGKQRYGLLLTDEGTIIDDLMFVNRGRDLFVIVNGACKVGDIAHIQARIGAALRRAAHARPGPAGTAGPAGRHRPVALVPGVDKLVFMTGGHFIWEGADLFITRSGYTGEDGFEISIPPAHAEPFARALLAQPEVKPIGLGARNSLRLEAGLCLYGNDIDTTTTPVEAALNWAIQKVRRTGGARAGGFPGADRVLAQLAGEGWCASAWAWWRWSACPCASTPNCRTPDGQRIGEVTSGLLGPTLNKPVAMGYVGTEYAAPSARV